jgi:hypothetical protein
LGIDQSMRDIGRFIDLTDDKGSSCSTRSSRVNQELEEEDEEVELAWEYKWFHYRQD